MSDDAERLRSVAVVSLLIRGVMEVRVCTSESRATCAMEMARMTGWGE